MKDPNNLVEQQRNNLEIEATPDEQQPPEPTPAEEAEASPVESESVTHAVNELLRISANGGNCAGISPRDSLALGIVKLLRTVDSLQKRVAALESQQVFPALEAPGRPTYCHHARIKFLCPECKG